jgi:hypothetical protein
MIWSQNNAQKKDNISRISVHVHLHMEHTYTHVQHTHTHVEYFGYDGGAFFLPQSTHGTERTLRRRTVVQHGGLIHIPVMMNGKGVLHTHVGVGLLFTKQKGL